MLGYGITKERRLSEDVLKLALKYTRLRLSKWDELNYDEIVNYGLKRSNLHSRIAEALDCDRELVENAFAKAAEPFGIRINQEYVVDGTMKNNEDFTKIYDAFCDNLLKVALREDTEDRHPNRITQKQLDEIENELCQLAVMPEL